MGTGEETRDAMRDDKLERGTAAASASDRKPLHIYAFADVICPWCWIGQRRMRRMLAERNDIDVSANWKPFQLNPHSPPEGESMHVVIDTKFGGIENAKQQWAHIESLGESEGLEFRFDLITRFPNTRRAHELVLFAATQGHTWATVEALYLANFREGLDVGDIDTLLEIGASVGLDRDAVREVFRDERFAPSVMASQREASSIGVSGVPFFVLNGKYGISGAQPEDVFRRGIAQAAGVTPQPAEASHADTDS